MLKQSPPFRFVVGSPSYDTAEIFYARLDPEISGKDNLLKALYYLLWFPGYFGFNWDALYDCLRDLAWIPCRKIVLVHHRLPKIPDNDLRVYLQVLKDSVLDWGVDEEHQLEIVFQDSDRDRVESLLA